MFGYNAQFKRCAIDGAKTLRVPRLSATTGVNELDQKTLRNLICAFLKVIETFWKYFENLRSS
jgi:hypothetical protein